MLTNKGNSTENKYLKLCCDSEIPRCSISHYVFTNLMLLMHPILVSGPAIRLSPVAEEDGGRDAQGDEQDAHHDGRDDPTAAGVKVARWQNLIPSFPWIAPGWRARGNPRKGRDQILPSGNLDSSNLAELCTHLHV